jgi:uncharacterized protein involved in response to NO
VSDATASAALPSYHPVWLAGFRPFFALACLSGLTLPLTWALAFTGRIEVAPAFASVQWHSHEMFYGFGWAMLGGFLLTATKNWVKIRGYHGGALAFLAAAWCLERIGMAFGAGWPRPLFLLSNQLFLATLVWMLLATLLGHRSTDSYRRDNVYFLVLLPLAPAAKYLLLDPAHAQAGQTMTLGLFRLAFLVMLERTLTDFMKNVFKAAILRHPLLDGAIKTLALAMVFAGFLPPAATVGLAVTVALLLIGRFAFWRPGRAFTRLDLGIMYLGYLGIVVQLLAVAMEGAVGVAWVGTVPTHLFTVGVMGLIVPAMIVRISKGHTGRKVAFDGLDRAVLWVMMLGLVMRVVAPQIVPGAYAAWLTLAATCWLAGFGTLAWRYVPFLLRPRVDGKLH